LRERFCGTFYLLTQIILLLYGGDHWAPPWSTSRSPPEDSIFNFRCQKV